MLAITVATAMITAVPLLGTWGGDQMVLTVTADGARVATDCGAGGFTGAPQLDAHGRFVAPGSFESFRPGPQRADAGSASPGATFAGEVAGETMVLTVRPDGEAERRYTLTQGRRIKLIRCL